jgi:predicted DNA-binding transcriptional regulator AlpA
MLHRATVWNTLQRRAPRTTRMPISIDGVVYVSASEAYAAIGVSRQTFWRWRREGLVPQGRRFRDGQLLFTRGEFQQALEYANRVEPLNPVNRGQLQLFDGAA